MAVPSLFVTAMFGVFPGISLSGTVLAKLLGKYLSLTYTRKQV